MNILIGFAYQTGNFCVRAVVRVIADGPGTAPPLRANAWPPLQGIPGCIPWGVIYAYFNDFLAQEKGMAIQVRPFTSVYFALMVVFVIGKPPPTTFIRTPECVSNPQNVYLHPSSPLSPPRWPFPEFGAPLELPLPAC